LLEDIRVQAILVDELYFLARLRYLGNVDDALHLEAHELTFQDLGADGLFTALNKAGEVIVENFAISLYKGYDDLVSERCSAPRHALHVERFSTNFRKNRADYEFKTNKCFKFSSA
jgi:hypothetical protein